jgi:hypothetical protein
MSITNQTYKVDSVMIRGSYNRLPTSTYVDTLILTFVADSTAGKFAFISFGGNTLANHGIDSCAMLLWSALDYQKVPLNQVSYNYTGNTLARARQFKIPLNAATFADSLSDGTHLIKAAPNVTVPNGGKVSMSVTFKSGTAYTAGSAIINYNFFSLMSHEIDQDGFVLYPATDQNMSYLAYKDSTNNDINATLYYYIPTIAYNGTGVNNFNSEIHDISWKVSCATCPKVSVNDVESNVVVSAAYPNPANTSINVPVKVKADASVTVTLTSLVGEVVNTTNLGKIGAAQTKTASFSTANLANGVYIYTVESAGYRVTDRVVVAH